MKITALSSFCVDYFPELDKVYVGGNSLNFAVQCKISGVEDVSVIGAIGNDSYGDLIMQYLKKVNVDHQRLYRIDAPTASNKIFISANGDRYFKEDSWQGGAFDKFRLSGTDWKYLEKRDLIAMPAGDPNLKSLLDRRHNEQLICIDFLDYHTLDFIEKLIHKIDVTFLSVSEDLLKNLETLAEKSGKMIVATLGAKGSIAFYRNKTYVQEAIKVKEVIDTTGCGDAFQAAFAIEWYASGDIEKSLFKGALAASHVTAFIGGVKQSLKM